MKHELVAKDDLWLTDLGMLSDFGSLGTSKSPQSAVRKFARSFARVWEQIPESDRKILRRHWKKGGRNLPDIALQSVIHMEGKTGHCDSMGHTFRFASEFITTMEPRRIVNLIAHELGHAMSYAQEWQKQHACDLSRGKLECVACECQAYSYMAAWGFDPFERWLPAPKKSLADRFRLLKRSI